jgi:pimeloyl-ACP methyl ester carboxylesterase
MTHRKKLVWLVASISLALVVGVGAIATRYLWKNRDDPRIQLVEANPAAGFHWPYFLYLPDPVSSSGIRFLVRPNNTNGGANDDFAEHLAGARHSIRGDRKRAQSLQAAVIMPVFPRTKAQWQLYTHALDRDTILTRDEALTRIDLQLIAMISDARRALKRRGIDVADRILMEGFSADGMFVSRFTLIHPELVQAAVIGAPGGWPMVPVAEWEGTPLRYPIGTFDFTTLFGNAFSVAEAKRVPMLFHLGDKDTNDSVPFADGYDSQDTELLMAVGKTPLERWDDAERLFRSAGFTNATFVVHKGAGHGTDETIETEIVTFLREHSAP